VALDPQTEKGETVAEAERRRLDTELAKLEKENGLVRVAATLAEAGWLLRYDSLTSGKLYLVPASGLHVAGQAVRAGGEALNRLPSLFGPVPAGDQTLPWLTDALSRIARARNLMTIAQESGDKLVQDDFSVKVKVELLRLSHENDPTGELVQNEGGEILFREGDWIAFRVSNEGREPVDVNLLFLDSGYGIEPGFPRKVTVDNRLLPKAKPLRIKAHVNSTTFGLEHIVLIAVKAKEVQPYANFTFLKQPTLDRARAVESTRGDELRGLKSPLGQLLANAMYADGETRGLGFDEDESSSNAYAFEVMRWRVSPRQVGERGGK
jgi:hypothetical protein